MVTVEMDGPGVLREQWSGVVDRCDVAVGRNGSVHVWYRVELDAVRDGEVVRVVDEGWSTCNDVSEPLDLVAETLVANLLVAGRRSWTSSGRVSGMSRVTRLRSWSGRCRCCGRLLGVRRSRIRELPMR